VLCGLYCLLLCGTGCLYLLLLYGLYCFSVCVLTVLPLAVWDCHLLLLCGLYCFSLCVLTVLPFAAWDCHLLLLCGLYCLSNVWIVLPFYCVDFTAFLLLSAWAVLSCTVWAVLHRFDA